MVNTDCLQMSVMWAVMAGMWMPQRCEGRAWSRLLYHVYSLAFQGLVFYPALHIQMSHIIHVRDDIEQVLDAAVLLAIHLITIPKLYVLFTNHHRIKQMFQKMNGPVFNRADPRKQRFIDRGVAFINTLTVVFRGMVTSTCVVWGVVPMFGSTATLPLRYPIMTGGVSFWFIMQYLYQCAIMEVLAMTATVVDLLVVAQLVLVTCALEVLHLDILDIGSDVIAEHSAKDVNYEYAVRCVKFHQEIISFVQELDDIYNMPLLLQFLASSVIICGTAFKVSITKSTSELMSKGSYLVCGVAELFLYCYLGDNMTAKSSLIAQAAYSCAWTGTSHRCRRVLLLMVLRAQRPLVLTGGNMFDVTLTMFAAVLRTSYSYFTVLHQKHNSDQSKQ